MQFRRALLTATTCIAFALSAIAATAEPYTLPDGREVTALDIFQECEVCPEMVVLPMGSFLFGAPIEQTLDTPRLLKLKPGQKPGRPQEGPEHKVIIDIPIAMGRNEVTREEWLACVDDGGCSHTPSSKIDRKGGAIYADDPRHPVMDVSYLDTLEYTAWLNSKIGADVYRLPTEVEWEYAAQAGTNTKFAQGDTLTSDQARFLVSVKVNGRWVTIPKGGGMPVLVDDLDAANAWGLRHMSGNVFERTMSCITQRHLGLETSRIYLDAFNQVKSCDRVVKGGAYPAHAEYARPASRGASSEGGRSSMIGFRIVRELGEKNANLR